MMYYGLFPSQILPAHYDLCRIVNNFYVSNEIVVVRSFHFGLAINELSQIRG